jgi:hypothetical protein
MISPASHGEPDMKNIMLRGIDPNLEKKIRTGAKAQKQSINQWILTALRRITGTAKDKNLQLYHDLDKLAGGWDESAAREFLKNTACFEQVDEDLFK